MNQALARLSKHSFGALIKDERERQTLKDVMSALDNPK